MLSGPQRKFVEGIVSGLDQTAAYRKAYPKSTAEAARRSGARLMTNGDIQAAVAKLRTKAESAVVLSLTRKRELLREIAEEGRKDSDRIRAIELDSKHTGDLKPDEVKFAGTWEVVIGEA